jgi:hypothetical protein
MIYSILLKYSIFAHNNAKRTIFRNIGRIEEQTPTLVADYNEAVK